MYFFPPHLSLWNSFWHLVLRFSEQVFSFIHTAVVVALLLSCIRLFVTPGTRARQASLSSAISRNLLKLMSIESMMPSNRLILCRPLLLLLSVFPSIKVFSSESALRIRWPKYWSFSFSISPFNEYSGLISSRTDCFDLLTVQRTVLLNSYLGIIFIFLITPVVLGCHHLLILLWCVTLFVGPKRNHIPQSNPPRRISTLHPLSDGDAVCYPHAFGSWFSGCRLWHVDLLEQIT